MRSPSAYKLKMKKGNEYMQQKEIFNVTKAQLMKSTGNANESVFNGEASVCTENAQ